jgi:uncharacterized protein YkvS
LVYCCLKWILKPTYSNAQIFADDTIQGIREFQGDIDRQWEDTNVISYVVVHTLSRYYLDNAIDTIGEIRDGNPVTLVPIALLSFGRFKVLTRFCFAAGTLILTDQGLMPIESIKIGDTVAARDDETGETQYRKVTALFENEESAVVDLTLVDDLGIREKIVVTKEHPFMTNNGWKTVVELSTEDVIQSYDGRILRMLSRVDNGQHARTYNFEVEAAHTYFVGVSGAWVHNVCKFRPPPWNMVTLDFDHVKSGHTLQGSRLIQSLKDGGVKDSFPDHFSDRYIMNSIRTAFRNAKIINSNAGHPRVQLEGVNTEGLRIQMWYSLDTMTMHSA